MFRRKKLWFVDLRINSASLDRYVGYDNYWTGLVVVNKNPPRASDSPEVEVTLAVIARDEDHAIEKAKAYDSAIPVFAARARKMRPL